MTLLLAVLLAALVTGALLGGRPSRLAELELRSPRLVVGALVVQLLGALVGGPVHAVGLACSAGLVLVFLRANRALRGTALVGLGLLANALVIAVNGAMPVSAGAAARAGVDVAAAVADGRHEPLTRASRLPALGDVVPVPLPVSPQVVSPGDLLVAAGLAWLVVAGMTGTARRAAEAQPSRPSAGG